MLDFYQPDEDLRVEDLLPDLQIANPEKQAGDHEVQQIVRSALDTLPKDESRALLLRYVAGLGVAEVERILARPQAEIDRLIHAARTHLRTALINAGAPHR